MTGINSNIDQLIKRIREKAGANEVDFSEALIAGVNVAMAKMQFRIFNSNKDINGNSLGKYVGPKAKPQKKTTDKLFKGRDKNFLVGVQTKYSPYELKRIRKGRQVRSKDLEFYGDVRRGFKVIRESNTKVICAIPNDTLFMIARAQEEQIAKILNKTEVKIFYLSNEEREALKLNTGAVLKQIYARLLQS